MENYKIEVPQADTQIEKVLYTANTHTVGGREGGSSRTSDGRLDIKLSVPGTPGEGTNPEQLFAAGWSSCFFSAMKIVAGPAITQQGATTLTAMGYPVLSLVLKILVSVCGFAALLNLLEFDVGTVLLEVFLFDFSGDLYGQAVDVAFVDWIRPELRFDTIEELVRRMDEDSRLARTSLARAPDAFPNLGDLTA